MVCVKCYKHDSVLGRLTCGWCRGEFAPQVQTQSCGEEKMIAFLRRPNEDGTPCSIEREALARAFERGDHWKT